MTARRIGVGIALVTLAVSAYYVLAYLFLWEWNRALIAGVFFLAIEVALGHLLVLDRVARIETRIDQLDDRAAQRRTIDVLHAHAPPPRDRFAWLDPRDSPQLGVFVPILLGAGVVLSGTAWVIERVARAVTGPARERGLATRLDALSVPPGGLLRRRPDPLRLRPDRAPRGR